jgi:hypothetical protein
VLNNTCGHALFYSFYKPAVVTTQGDVARMFWINAAKKGNQQEQ